MLKKIFTTALATTMLLTSTAYAGTRVIQAPEDWNLWDSMMNRTPEEQAEMDARMAAQEAAEKAELERKLEYMNSLDWDHLPPAPNANYNKPVDKRVTYMFIPRIGYLWGGMTKTQIDHILEGFSTPEDKGEKHPYGEGYGTTLSWNDGFVEIVDCEKGGTLEHAYYYKYNDVATLQVSYVTGVDGVMYAAGISIDFVPGAYAYYWDSQTQQPVILKATGEHRNPDRSDVEDAADVSSGITETYPVPGVGLTAYGYSDPSGNYRYPEI